MGVSFLKVNKVYDLNILPCFFGIDQRLINIEFVFWCWSIFLSIDGLGFSYFSDQLLLVCYILRCWGIGEWISFIRVFSFSGGFPIPEKWPFSFMHHTYHILLVRNAIRNVVYFLYGHFELPVSMLAGIMRRVYFQICLIALLLLG